MTTQTVMGQKGQLKHQSKGQLALLPLKGGTHWRTWPFDFGLALESAESPCARPEAGAPLGMSHGAYPTAGWFSPEVVRFGAGGQPLGFRDARASDAAALALDSFRPQNAAPIRHNHGIESSETQQTQAFLGAHSINNRVRLGANR